jgi:lipid-binding SYLF domain-containing protein
MSSNSVENIYQGEVKFQASCYRPAGSQSGINLMKSTGNNDRFCDVSSLTMSHNNNNNHISNPQQNGPATSFHPSLCDCTNSWSVVRNERPVYPGSNHLMSAKACYKLEREIQKAVKVVTRFCNPKLLKDQVIPRELLIEAYGLVFLTVIKAGFVFSGKIGKGFVISRTTNGWSAPCFLTSGGVGFGMMAGGEIVNYMLVLNSRGAVKVFTRNGQIQVGSELDIAVGPIGRAASASINVGYGGFAPNYSYSHSMGLYGGIGLSGAFFCTRKTFNAQCYGREVTAKQILEGEIPCTQAVPLWQVLDQTLGMKREYIDGFPVVLIDDVHTCKCDTCGYENPSDLHACRQCATLLIFSVGIHSGKRQASRLVLSFPSA